MSIAHLLSLCYRKAFSPATIRTQYWNLKNADKPKMEAYMRRIEVAIITTGAPQDAIRLEFPNYLILNDHNFYKMMNGGCKFNGMNISFHQDDLIEAVENFLPLLSTDNIVIHTFNPMVLQALDEDENQNKELVKSFYIYSEIVGFQNLLKHKSIVEKLTILSIGETVNDTLMKSIISDFESGNNII
jgi:hypothetical protein